MYVHEKLKNALLIWIIPSEQRVFCALKWLFQVGQRIGNMQFGSDGQAFFIDIEFLVVMSVGCLFAALRADEAVDTARDRQVIRKIVSAHAFRAVGDDVLDADDVRGDLDGMVGCLDVIDQRCRGIVVGELDGCAVRIGNIPGDPFHSLQHLIADFVAECPDGAFDFGFVGDDVVVCASAQHPDANHDFIGGADFPRDDGLEFRDDGGCADQGIASQIRTRGRVRSCRKL